jgi:Fe-S cluster biogenesis protein NfuA
LQAARSSPLADELFNIEGVRGILLGKDFLTVTRDPKGPTWAQLNPQVYAAIMDFIHSGRPVLSENPAEAELTASAAESNESASEVVAMIREILDTRIRPTVQQDGGDIQYCGFDSATGFVRLQLTGACRSCSSSTITLRNGIEAMLMHYVPEVKGVEQVLDETAQTAERAFKAFEHGKEGQGK